MRLSTKIGLLISIFTLFVVCLAGGMVYGLLKATTPIEVSWLLMVLLLIIVLTLGVIGVLVRQITNPIKAVSEAINRIALGDLSQEVPIHSNDELGLLSRRFSEMTRQLSGSYRSLEASTEEAQARRAELEASINSLRQGFILTDTHNKVLMANAAASAIIHGDASPAQRAISFSDIERLMPSDMPLAAKIKQAFQDGQPTKYAEVPLGGRFLNIYLSPVVSGKGASGCVLLIEDITEERIAARSREEFFSIASHELRTPLTAIRGNASMLQQYFPELIQKNPEVHDMVADIHESAVRLIDIVNDFLDASSLEQGQMKFETKAFNIEPIIKKVIEDMEELAKKKAVRISFDAEAHGKSLQAFADPARVTEVLYNLIGNAVKFTEQGTVTVSCQKQGAHIKVLVEDTGIGISPEGQQILFHKFQQSADSILTRDNTRGTGLGLYISKLMIEHMGGTIKLEHAAVGKGSAFSFALPVATAAQAKSS